VVKALPKGAQYTITRSDVENIRSSKDAHANPRRVLALRKAVADPV
jgi:hypothetical protein